MDQPIALQEAGEKFKNYLRSNNKAAATILAYSKDIDQLVLFLQQQQRKQIQEVTSSDIQAFLASLQSKGYTAKSLSRKLNSTRTFYRFLKVNKLAVDDPSLLVPHPKYALSAPRVLSPLEYRALRDVALGDRRIYAIIEVLLQTGIRIGELANLRMQEVKENLLSIHAFEGHAAREVPLNKRAKEALKKYFEVRPKTGSDFVFITKTGKQFLVRNIRDSIERYLRKAGIENAKVNDLRHTFVAHHLKNGTSLVFLSKIIGHKRLSSTERYLGFIKYKEGNGASLIEL